ncbi:uncharacterized protein LOC129944391 [Eupeodes corollae]|uniref:uncharacterized protein LOC129944391 n=1 Tax=Eupeodes corollae TaxID=290404 RepID=UPI002490C28A|nr:uncharacterized protein LOC129944391 [Eupeodes corollae]XP_055909749.1 uncharacterized protein LOC129944391 [Eupeodes corollae]XP_055909750.1 uncharacterized protein LOC129944391 [Eupeodes corollae]
MMWGEHLSRRHWEFQKTTNDNNYCYLNTNPHCVKENNAYVHNLPPYNDRLAVNILEVDNKKHDYVKNEYKTENKILNHNSGINSSLDVSKPVSTSPCNNLYVSPPFFTVDKFVNMEQTSSHRGDNRQIVQPHRNHTHHNQKEISNISLEYKIPENRESFLINNKNLIGIKVIDNSHIPLMHFETSDRPVMLNVPKQYEQQPVITEICNYENDMVSYGSESYQKRRKPYSSMNYVQDPSPKNDFVRNQLLSIHQYNGDSIIKVESKNIYRMSDLGATIESSPHRAGPSEFQCMEFQKNSLQNGYGNGKSCIAPPKQISNEKKKPNYRELINNANALRSSISENDLNMQIIKRTLNYKKLPTCNFPSRNIAIQSSKRNNDNICQKIEKSNMYEKGHVNHHLFIQYPNDEGSACKRPNIASPLDLSIKTIKTEPDIDKKRVYEGGVITEQGCPPKYNFEPNFLEKQDFMSNNMHSSRLQSNPNSVIRFNSNSRRPPPMDCKLEQNVFIQGPNPVVSANVNNNHLVDKLSDSELDINRKRPYPVQHFDDSKYLIKKKCLKSSFCASLIADPLKFEAEYSNQTSVIKNVQLKSSNGNDISSVFDHTIIKPEPEPELELESELKPEIKPDLKPALNCEFKPELESVEEHEPILELQPQIQIQPEPESVNLMELKQDISTASFASRIRTKAELKGFVFQDEGTDVQSKNVELKTSLDLCAWNTTCDKFLNQLDQCFEKTPPKLVSSKVLQQPSMPNVQSDSENESLCSSNRSPKRSIKRVKTDKPKLPVEQVKNGDTDPIESVNNSPHTQLMGNCSNSVNTETTSSVSDPLSSQTMVAVTDPVETEVIDNVVNSVMPEQRNSETDSVNTSTIKCDLEERCTPVVENVSENVNKDSSPDNQTSSPDCSPTNNLKTPIKKATRLFDLTKVSVVRLKREKYVSRILKLSDEATEQPCDLEEDSRSPENRKIDSTTKCKSPDLQLPVSTSETQPALRSTVNRYSFSRGRPPKGEKASKTNSQNSNTIKTRLRTQALQSQKDSVFKNNKSKRRFENKSESELPSNTEKIFLEVYRYKRALKIPPNLITIKSKCVQKISKCIDDSDMDQKVTTTTSKNGESTNSSECNNKDNVPKSIIDVLHSRVVKAKHHHQHNKFTQKYMKNERQHVSNFKSKIQQFNFPKSNSDRHQPILNENNNNCLQEKRNVFETKVIPSRTRREHKMQLSKETIREVFRGDERPSSAPPHINNLEDIYDRSYNDQCIKYFQKLSQCAAEFDLQKKDECKNSEKQEEDANKFTCSNKIKEPEKVKDDNQCNNNLNKSNRKRKRRIYKRRISSGFDYLRKKKRANTCALRNYSRFKRRKSTTEENFSFRSESDILKEIQKWVLNKGVGQSALHKAATLGYIDVIVYCLERMGLHPDHKDNAGYTPLHDACVNGNLDIARVLLQYGANHSESAHSGIRPIHEASENGHIEIVRMLLSYGADPLLETYSGQTPLMLASDPKVSSLISTHLKDIQVSEEKRKTWSFQGPWNGNDENENGCNVFSDISSLDISEGSLQKRHNFRRDFRYFQNNEWKRDGKELLSICNQNPSIKNIFCDFEFLYDAANAEGELFEFEEADSPLPPLYLLKDEGMEKWVLLSDLCSLLKVKSKDTLLHKIFPSVSPSLVSRTFLRELKMCEFLERATCLQLLCAGEKINICHSKVVLIRYNENVRNLLGVKTIIMKL